MANRIILDHKLFDLTLERLSHELIENYDNFENTVIVGIQPRGVPLADELIKRLQEKFKVEIVYGKLDPTFHRDDFRSRDFPLEGNANDMEVTIEGRKVLLIDDVLYTGRTIRASMDALLTYGRPEKVELLVLIDRRFNRELPIQPDYTGREVDTIEDAKVKVEWDRKRNRNKVLIFHEFKEE